MGEQFCNNRKQAEQIRFKYDGYEIKEKFWGDNDIPSGSCVQMIIEMWSQSKTSAKDLEFDLSWTCRNTRFLNGTAFLYSENDYKGMIDFKGIRSNSRGMHDYARALHHSGRSSPNNLHQRIKVNLEFLPTEITKIYFTLSGNASGKGSDCLLRDIMAPRVTLKNDCGQVVSEYVSDTREHGSYSAVILCVAI